MLAKRRRPLGRSKKSGSLQREPSKLLRNHLNGIPRLCRRCDRSKAARATPANSSESLAMTAHQPRGLCRFRSSTSVRDNSSRVGGCSPVWLGDRIFLPPISPLTGVMRLPWLSHPPLMWVAGRGHPRASSAQIRSNLWSYQELSLCRKVSMTCDYSQSHEAQYERIDLYYRPNRRDNGDFVLPRTALSARNGNDTFRTVGASNRARF